ncbi:MAG TPA: hypothetical protein VK203_18545 [Nostocaceae cyanobacterium]|nr:hypothetical protein [Nostocaceae cyanobacterium]
MFYEQPKPVEILKKETIDKTTWVLFKHKDKELYAVKTESILNRNPDGLYDWMWDSILGAVKTREEAEALFIRSVEAEKYIRLTNEKYSKPPTYNSLEEKVHELYNGDTNSDSSKHLKQICDRLKDISCSSNDSSNKYFIIEPLILAIIGNLPERVWELSGIDSPPELPQVAKERIQLETEYVKKLHQSIEEALECLYELRQLGAELH